jgi:hypothetical protein
MLLIWKEKKKEKKNLGVVLEEIIKNVVSNQGASSKRFCR